MTLHLRPTNNQDETIASFRVKPESDLDPAGETGWFLQRERERRGKTLADAALETRISAKYLHAIEYGRLDELPDRSYVLGYIRVYADCLGLEADPLVDHYKGLLPARPSRRGRRARSGATAMAGFITMACALVIVLAGAVWLAVPELMGRTQSVERMPPATVTLAEEDQETINTGSLPEDQEEVSEDVESQKLDEALPTVRVKQRGFSDVGELEATNRSVDSLQPDDKTLVTENAPDGGDQTEGLTEFIRQHVSEARAEEDEETSAPGEGKTFGKENTDARIVLTATQSVWIRVEDTQGNVLITRTLGRGDAYRVPNRGGLLLIARDGGALEYSIDGERKGAIGASGQIVVGRSLDIDQLERRGG